MIEESYADNVARRLSCQIFRVSNYPADIESNARPASTACSVEPIIA